MKSLTKIFNTMLRIALVKEKRVTRQGDFVKKTNIDYENEIFEFLQNSKIEREEYGISDAMVIDFINYLMSRRSVCIKLDESSYDILHHHSPNSLIIRYAKHTVMNNKMNWVYDELVNWVQILTSVRSDENVCSTYNLPLPPLDEYNDKAEIQSALNMRRFIHKNFISIGKTNAECVNIDDVYKAYHLFDDDLTDDLDLFKTIIYHSGFDIDHSKLSSFEYTADGAMLFKYIIPCTK